MPTTRKRAGSAAKKRTAGGPQGVRSGTAKSAGGARKRAVKKR